MFDCAICYNYFPIFGHFFGNLVSKSIDNLNKK